MTNLTVLSVNHQDILKSESSAKHENLHIYLYDGFGFIQNYAQDKLSQIQRVASIVLLGLKLPYKV